MLLYGVDIRFYMQIENELRCMCKLCENDYNLLTGTSYPIASQDPIIRASTGVPDGSLGTQ